ncbi:MAG: hypothetical protein KBF63_20275, partial [Rhodoferax sp.]|nr:hypothetical protein [Rhodoferax sp.]
MITFTRDWRGYANGTSVGTLADTIEALAVAEGAAIYGGVAGPLNSYLDADNRTKALVDGGGNAFPLTANDGLGRPANVAKSAKSYALTYNADGSILR